MKSLTFNFRIALSVLLCCVALATVARAQEEKAALSWVKVAPPNEAFTVLMPQKPSAVAEKRKHRMLSLTGKRYSVRGSDDTIYTVWSFKSENLSVGLRSDTASYLDLCAELAWEMIIEPERAKAVHESRITPETRYALTYEGEYQSPTHPGRSYRLNLGTQSGTLIIHAVETRFYIAAAWNPDRIIGEMEKFIDSFTVHPPMRAEGKGTTYRPGRASGSNERTSGVGTGEGIGSGRGSGNDIISGGGSGEAKETDYNRTFTVREVTKKAQILAKPEPSYTEWARKFGVTGTVRIRLILRASGEVGDIGHVNKLPHGLTQQAIEAARRISFTPAEKDGRKVSQYVTIEYNFNIY